jgi:hypothetical protein
MPRRQPPKADLLVITGHHAGLFRLFVLDQDRLQLFALGRRQCAQIDREPR